MLRAMLLEFPDDPACDTLDRQYLLGDSLLVAPVFTEDGAVNYYLPAGRWTHLVTGEVQEGGRWHQATHNFLSLPLFVRPNTILPVGATNDRPDYDYTAGTTFRLYELADGATASRSVPKPTGEAGLEITAQRQGRTIDIALRGAGPGCTVQLVGVAAIAKVDGAATRSETAGLVLVPAAGATQIRVTL
jgi:alpha-D-xyloside xylohydrolase